MTSKKKEHPQPPTDLSHFLEEVRRKAHEIYLARHRENAPGDDISDWLKAEEIVKKKISL